MLREQFHAPLSVSDMSFPQIEKQIMRCPAIILPVGGLEPIGSDLPLGMVNECCDAIAQALSIRLEVPVAPLLAYGNSTPFNAFGGSAGVHRDTMVNVVAECCKCWLFHGFQRIMVLSIAMDALPGLEAAAKRICALPGRKSAMRCCSLQENEQFVSYCAARSSMVESGRSEWGIRALARYLLPANSTAGEPAIAAKLPVPAELKQWHRRGRDPEKLRKIAPAALFSSGGRVPDAAAGKDLFETTVAFLIREFTPFLIVKDNASR